jgi:hypothetical protein
MTRKPLDILELVALAVALIAALLILSAVPGA